MQKKKTIETITETFEDIKQKIKYNGNGNMVLQIIMEYAKANNNKKINPIL